MKIVHASDINLGKKFSGLKLAGDKIRAGLKTSFSNIIDHTINSKADMLIIAGNLFDNINISVNLQEYILSELGRLETVPAVIIPGSNDMSSDGVFWRSWENSEKHKNVFIFKDSKNPYFKFENLNCTVYGLFTDDDKAVKLEKQDTGFHIGVLNCPSDLARNIITKTEINFDYVAIGGKSDFMDLSDSDIKAAYCGAPEKLGFDQTEGGNIIIVDIDSPGNANLAKTEIGKMTWRDIEMKAEEILSNDDLTKHLEEMAGSEIALRLKLTGLALFETDLAPARIEEQMADHFLFLEIIDEMKVLPENVSEVKVSEKTLLGQYIKVMADEIGGAGEKIRPRLEKSLKIGYALLQGREIW
jgi:exonuclease SbcD